MRQLTARERAANYAGIALGLPGFTARPFAPRALTTADQLLRLRRLVAHAYARVPLYRELYRGAGVRPDDLRSLADLARFPTVTKRDILDAWPDGCLATGVDLSRCLVSKSSGSTGEILPVVHRADRLAIQGLALHRLLSMAGSYGPRDRFAYVYTSEYPARGALGAYPMEWIHTLSPLDVILDRLERGRPSFVACYPSHLRAIADALGPGRARSLGIRAISVSSEPSTDAERLALGALFGCPVLDEFSTEELTRVAAQCRARRHHIFEDVVLVEVLRRDADVAVATSESGELVGTYLHNLAMPFIRYRQGDVVRVDDAGRCPCGRTTRTLGAIEGRRLDAFVLPSGRVLTSGYLLDATYAFLFDLEADLAAYRMTQERRDLVRIDIVPGAGYRASMGDAIARRFRQLAGEPIEVVVDVVAAIDRSGGGKHHPIRTLVDAAGRGRARAGEPT
jgi:phenylacetate-CoA ligase